jgi:hypothetical protein
MWLGCSRVLAAIFFLIVANQARADTILTYTITTPAPNQGSVGGHVMVDDAVTGTFSVDTTTDEIVSSSLQAAIFVDETDTLRDPDPYYGIEMGSFTFTGAGTITAGDVYSIVNGDSQISITAPALDVGSNFLVDYTIPVTNTLFFIDPESSIIIPPTSDTTTIADEVTQVDCCSIPQTPLPNSFILFVSALAISLWIVMRREKGTLGCYRLMPDRHHA